MEFFKKYKYWLLIFLLLESLLVMFLSNTKQLRTQKYIQYKSSIITSNYNTIYNILLKEKSDKNFHLSDFKEIQKQIENSFSLSTLILIHKDDIKKENYIQSEENPEYYYENNSLNSPVSINKHNKKFFKLIDENLKETNVFNVYHFSDKSILATFIPLENIQAYKHPAYLLVYQKADYLKEINSNYFILLLAGSFALLLSIAFIYKTKNEKKRLETKVNRKTNQLKNLNKKLEEKVKRRTQEQSTLLSLFDKGDNVLFKWVNNDSWDVEYVSKSVEKFFGYERDEFLSSKIAYAQMVHKDDLADVMKEVKKNISSNADFFIHKPYRIVNKTGEIKWVKDYTISVKNEKNEIIYFVGYISDITIEVTHHLELQKEVETKTKSLKELNDTLEKQVEIEILKNLEKEKLISQQSKMASMGEMLANIAHQWKQPLNSISLSASGMQVQKELDLLNDEIFNNGIDSIISSTDFLAQTIDDFRNFLKPDNKVKEFDLKDSIEKSLQLVAATFKNNSIKTSIDVPNVMIRGVQGDFTQVILNILNNAKDILIEKNKSNDRFIFIDAILLNNEILINIKDNAGGIPEDIINNIFDQYFTTKDINGTGIGLHMSKEIISERMQGKLEVVNENFKYEENYYCGAKFIITLPKVKIPN